MSTAQIAQSMHPIGPSRAAHRARGKTERRSRARLWREVSIGVGLATLALLLAVLVTHAGAPNPTLAQGYADLAASPHARLEISPPNDGVLIDVMPVP
jgi:hypothetical protein